jgi:sortase A
MTLMSPPPPSARDAGVGPGGGIGKQGSARAASASVRDRQAPSPATLAREAAGTAMWILAISLIGFVVWFWLFSRLYYDRAQHDAYANFRNSLAMAIAPTGPTQLDLSNPTAPPHLLAPGTPVTVLTIPEIGLKAVVFEGTSGQVLESGPGHLRYTQLPGQAGWSVIFGRRTGFGGPFSQLPRLRAGDTFTAITGQGVSTYRVIDLRHGGDPTPVPLAAGEGRLTLTTADGPPLMPTGALYVDADLISKPYATPAMPLTSASIGPAEQALGTDSLAWVPLVLWGWGLFIAAGVLAWCKQRWGRWQTWIVAVPVMAFLGLSIADQVSRLLPNIM